VQNGVKWSLFIFVVICGVNMLGLALDELLERQGSRTISDHVRSHPWLGIPIVLLQACATVALAYHFWASPRR
jgi:hypothetical protein